MQAFSPSVVTAIGQQLATARSIPGLLTELGNCLSPAVSHEVIRLTLIGEEDGSIRQFGLVKPDETGALSPVQEQFADGHHARWLHFYQTTAAGVHTLPEDLFPGHLPASAAEKTWKAAVIPLQAAGRRTGVLELLSASGDGWTTTSFSLLEAVAWQVGGLLVALETREQLTEKNIMVSLSEDIATIRDQADLYRVMMEKLRPLTDFEDAVVVLIQNEQYNQLFTMATPERRAHELYERIVKVVLPLKGSPFEFFLAQDAIYPWSVEEMLTRYPGYEGLLLMRETGLSHSITIQIWYGGKILGLVLLHYQQPPQLDDRKRRRFKTIADLLAVALSNVLANQEITRRDQEKAVLLSVSEKLSAIRSKHDLFQITFNQLKSLFHLDEAALVLFSPKQEAVQYWQAVPQSIAGDSDNFEILLQSIPLPDSFRQELEKQESPRILSGPELAGIFPGYPQGTPPRFRSQAEHLLMPLRFGDKLLGVFEFQSWKPGCFRPDNLPLYQSLAEQLAVTVSNVLANEALEASEREKTLQLTLTGILTRPDDWNTKMLSVVRALQPFISFDFVVLDLEKNRKSGDGFNYYRTGYDEYQPIVLEDFLRLTNLSAEKFRELRAGLHYENPLLLNGKDFVAYCKQHPLKRLTADTFRLQSNLVFPFTLSRDGAFAFSFYSKKPDTYRREHLDLLERIEHTLVLTLEKILAYEEIEKLTVQLRQEKTYLMEEVKTKYNYEEIIGTSPVLQNVFRAVSSVAPTDTTVLIIGETGTGKELIARAIHNQSPRKDRPLIKVNCAALPAQLIESELFGHEKGAFTGALDRRIGKFEMAHQGTIFLDEIGELPLELQAKLLRVLQEKEIERIGGKTTIPVDFRVIAATNRELEKEVTAGRFRSDLFYRLHIFPVQLPPLRERREDIPLLATYFGQKFSRKMGKPFAGILPATLTEMLSYDWPGNIRQLENAMEQAVILSGNRIIEWNRPVTNPSGNALPLQRTNPVLPPLPPDRDIKWQRTQWEKGRIMQALDKSHGRIRGTNGAAALLGIKPTTLEAKMKKLGILKKHFA